MGVHCPDLCLGVSLGRDKHWHALVIVVIDCSFIGAWTSRWKIVQSTGRVGRNPDQSAAYVTVVEKKVVVRGWFLIIAHSISLLVRRTY